MFGISRRLLAPTRRADMEVGNVPGFDQAPKGVGSLEALELAQPFDGQNIWRVEFLNLPLKLFIGLAEIFFVGNGVAFTIGEIEKMKRFAMRTTLVTQNFAFDVGRPGLLANLQGVGNQAILFEN